MKPNKFQHDTKLYSLSAQLSQSRLLLSLTYKANSQLYTASYQHHQLPSTLTDSMPTLLDILFLFQNPKNFTVKSEGCITLIIKSLQRNEIIETVVPLQLHLFNPQVEEPMEMTSSELIEEVRNLRKTVSLMETKIQTIEEKLPGKEFPLPRLHPHLEPELHMRMEAEKEKLAGKNLNVSSSSEEKRRMRNLEDRLEEAEEEIKRIKQVLFPELNLNDKGLGDEGIKYLGEENFPASLTKLYLRDNKLTLKGIASLSKQTWTKLERLYLSGNRIGDKGIPYLRSFPQLKKLNLWECGLSAKGVEALSKLQFSPHLLELGLSWNNIGDEGVRHLHNFNKLTYLDLKACWISGQGVERLSEMHFPKLKTLYLQENQIGGQDKVILKKWAKRQKGIDICY